MSNTQEEQDVINDIKENNVSVEEDKNETVEASAEDIKEELSTEETSTEEDVIDAPVEELSEVDQLNEKIKELEESVTTEKDKYLRACAEIENVKKRKKFNYTSLPYHQSSNVTKWTISSTCICSYYNINTSY